MILAVCRSSSLPSEAIEIESLERLSLRACPYPLLSEDIERELANDAEGEMA
jgi:hypothetical protein